MYITWKSSFLAYSMFDSPAKMFFLFFFNRNPPLIVSPTLCHITPHPLIPPPAPCCCHCSLFSTLLNALRGCWPTRLSTSWCEFLLSHANLQPTKATQHEFGREHMGHTYQHTHTHTHNVHLRVCVCAKGFRLSTYYMATSVWPGGVGTGEQLGGLWVRNRNVVVK